MKSFLQFAFVLAIAGVLFAEVAPIQIAPITIENIIETNDASGPSLNEVFVVPGGFSPEISDAFEFNPDLFKPEIYTLSISAMGAFSTSMPPSRMEVVKHTSTHDELALTHNFDTSNLTRVDVIRISGSGLTTATSKSFTWGGYDTALFSTASPKAGETLLAGRYRVSSSSSRPTLFKMNYYGGSNTLVQVPIGLTSNSAIVDIDTAYATVSYSKDYAMLIDEVSGSTRHSGLLFRNYAGTLRYFTFTKDYVTDSHYHVRGGRFMSSTKYGFALVASSGRATDVYLYDVSGGNFAPKALKAIKTTTGKNIMASGVAASDLDGDGQEELIIAGGYNTYGNFMKYSDVVQIYRYSSGNLVLVAEKLNSTGGLSWALAADAYDIDSDGKKEIITFDWAAAYSGGGLAPKGIANVYEFSGSGLSHTSSSNFSTSALSPTNYYDPQRARFGDFDGDGKKEVAVEYIQKTGYTAALRIAILEFMKDSAGPSITIVSPSSPSVKKPGNLSIAFTATDNAGVDPASMKYEINCSGYASGYKYGILSNSSGGKTMHLEATFQASALPAGNCTLTAHASDNAWNSNKRDMALSVSSTIVFGLGFEMEFVPLYNFTNASNASNVTPSIPEPEATPSPEPETTPAEEPVPEETAAEEPMAETGTATETSGSAEETSESGETIAGESGSDAGTVPSDDGSGAAADEEGEAGDSKASDLIAELEVKISIAKEQGGDTAAAEKFLADAKQAQSESKPIEAALAAQQGVSAVDQALKVQPTQQDNTPYYVAGGIILALGLAYIFTRKPPGK